MQNIGEHILLMAIVCILSYSVGVIQMLLLNKIKKREQGPQFITLSTTPEMKKFKQWVSCLRPSILIQESDCQGQLDRLRRRYQTVVKQLEKEVLSNS
jgi:hypothetical protein